MKNSDIFLAGLYSVLGNMWEEYKLPAHLEEKWKKVDKLYNSRKINWKIFIMDHNKEFVETVDYLKALYC